MYCINCNRNFDHDFDHKLDNIYTQTSSRYSAYKKGLKPKEISMKEYRANNPWNRNKKFLNGLSLDHPGFANKLKKATKHVCDIGENRLKLRPSEKKLLENKCGKVFAKSVVVKFREFKRERVGNKFVETKFFN